MKMHNCLGLTKTVVMLGKEVGEDIPYEPPHRAPTEAFGVDRSKKSRRQHRCFYCKYFYDLVRNRIGELTTSLKAQHQLRLRQYAESVGEEPEDLASQILTEWIRENTEVGHYS